APRRAAGPLRPPRAHPHRPLPQPARPARPTAARLVLTAARGECWIVVRTRSQSGRLLYASLLGQGRTLAFAQPRLWVRLGAPGNIDVRVNGRRVHRFQGGAPTNVLVTTAGLRTIS